MAASAIGQKSRVRLDLESSYGTEKGTPAGFYFAVYNDQIKDDQDQIPNESIRGDFNANDPANGLFRPDGPLSLILTPTISPYFAKILTGNITTTGTNPYTHTSKVSTNGPLSFVAEKSFTFASTTYYNKFNGGMFNRMVIPLDAAGFLLAQFDGMTQKLTQSITAYGGSATDWSSGAPANPFDMTQIAPADCVIGGSAAGFVKKGSITIDQALDGTDARVGGLGYRDSIVPGGPCSVTASFTLAVDRAAVFSLIQAGTYTDLSFRWTYATNRSFQVNIPRAWTKRTSVPLKGRGAVDVELMAIAAYDTTATTSLSFVTVNDIASGSYV